MIPWGGQVGCQVEGSHIFRFSPHRVWSFIFFPFPIVCPRPLICLPLSPPPSLRPHVPETIKLLLQLLREKEEMKGWLIVRFVSFVVGQLWEGRN